MPEREPLSERALRFAARVVDECRRIEKADPFHRPTTQQLFRAAAGIGAQLEEGLAASSRRDMAQKYAIALREAREALYWLRLLEMTAARGPDISVLRNEANQLVAILTTSVRKLRLPAPEPIGISEDPPTSTLV